MILVIGGLFQHKLDFVYDKFGMSEADVFFAENNYKIESERIIYKFNKLIEKWIAENRNVLEETEKFIGINKNSIIILDQIGCGIVPADKYERMLREETGRAGSVLAEYAEQVYSVSFGLGIRLKG
ncbi:bifunctional adenosylcobinamide kinase/adenosylcobinamide-phosphate guanylyltransferase [Lachnospiraceae bacterium NSJ-143]|nr:bifunctional adenosylcobinamide kinase/adenosylcobinamide-phosphate guanylyltransferase [Lachnospiraceae bacterium NSJ-143]